MRHVRGPGAVGYVTGGHGTVIFALLALWCASALVVVAWLGLARWALTPACVGVASLALSGWGLAHWEQRLRQPRVLLWTGSAWVLRTATDATGVSDQSLRRVEVCVDLQRLVLLRCVAEGRAAVTWLVLIRTPEARDDWHLLRCALYAFVPEGAAR